ncbi:UDP-N-acetylmuramate dehydrogenase [Gallicola sp. Sow4_E12]|uniref:UDP-N-acetylmuramate dehydrogenase n=1 Tax=Gallicola sp. Sow4_E12 TaxID=3438785 RepID=UPI003F903BCC
MDYKIFENGNYGEVRFSEEMKNHTTFEIGGPCDVMIIPENKEQVLNTLKTIKEHDFSYMVIGNGSNLLVSDQGLRMVIIKLGEAFSQIKIEGEKVYAQAGAELAEVAKASIEEGLAGMEYVSGIPGNIGGAITMNAGAYGGEMKDIVGTVTCLGQDLEIRTYTNEDMHFSYRHSRVQEENLIVLEVELALEKGNQEEIDELYHSLTQRREEKQPLEYASAGSTFKRPEGYYAGKLIDDAGLRGYKHNNAMVSEKHCGFVINTGGAACDDVLYIIRHIQKEIYDKYRVKLQTEVKILGEEI